MFWFIIRREWIFWKYRNWTLLSGQVPKDFIPVACADSCVRLFESWLSQGSHEVAKSLRDRLPQRSPTQALEGHCPACFRCFPSSTQQIQMNGSWTCADLGDKLMVIHSFESAVLDWEHWLIYLSSVFLKCLFQDYTTVQCYALLISCWLLFLHFWHVKMLGNKLKIEWAINHNCRKTIRSWSTL